MSSLGDFLSVRTGKDLLGAIGPGLVGGSLFYFILFLHFADFGILPVIGSIAFIIGILLVAITPLIMNKLIVTPKAIAKPAVIHNYMVFSELASIKDKKVKSTFKDSLKNRFQQQVEADLDYYRLISKNKQLVKDDFSEETISRRSIVNKEIKFENYISIILIFLISIGMSILGILSSSIPFLDGSQNTEFVSMNEEAIYWGIITILSVICIILALSIVREREDLLNYYRLIFTTSNRPNHRSSVELREEIRETKDQISKIMKDQANFSSQIIKDLEIEYNETLRIESAQAVLLQKVAKDLLQQKQKLDESLQSEMIFLINCFNNEFPLIKNTKILDLETFKVWDPESTDIEIRNAAHKLVSIEREDVVFDLLKDPKTNTKNKLIVLKLIYDKNWINLLKTQKTTIMSIIQTNLERSIDISIRSTLLLILSNLGEDETILNNIMSNWNKLYKATDFSLNRRNLINPRLYLYACSSHISHVPHLVKLLQRPDFIHLIQSAFNFDLFKHTDNIQSFNLKLANSELTQRLFYDNYFKTADGVTPQQLDSLMKQIVKFDWLDVKYKEKIITEIYNIIKINDLSFKTFVNSQASNFHSLYQNHSKFFILFYRCIVDDDINHLETLFRNFQSDINSFASTKNIEIIKDCINFTLYMFSNSFDQHYTIKEVHNSSENSLFIIDKFTYHEVDIGYDHLDFDKIQEFNSSTIFDYHPILTQIKQEKLEYIPGIFVVGTILNSSNQHMNLTSQYHRILSDENNKIKNPELKKELFISLIISWSLSNQKEAQSETILPLLRSNTNYFHDHDNIMRYLDDLSQ